MSTKDRVSLPSINSTQLELSNNYNIQSEPEITDIAYLKFKLATSHHLIAPTLPEYPIGTNHVK